MKGSKQIHSVYSTLEEFLNLECRDDNEKPDMKSSGMLVYQVNHKKKTNEEPRVS